MPTIGNCALCKGTNLNYIFGDDLTKSLKEVSETNRVGNILSRKPTVSFQHPMISKQFSMGNNFLYQGQGLSKRYHNRNQQKNSLIIGPGSSPRTWSHKTKTKTRYDHHKIVTSQVKKLKITS